MSSAARRKPKRRMNRPEEAIHKPCVQLLDAVLDFDRARYFCVPNQRGTRSAWENQFLKSMGVKAGVPDLILLVSRPAYPGANANVLVAIGVEFKTPSTSLSDAQRPWRTFFIQSGGVFVVIRSLDQMMDFLKTEEIPLRVGARL